MKSIAIATDSNSGISMQESKASEIYVLNMPCIIDDEIYYENINIDQEKFFRLVQGGAKVSTSQPTLNQLDELWNEALKEHEQVIYIPMSSGLSGSCASATAYAKENYNNKVFVVDNKRISIGQRHSAYIAKELVAKGYSASDIKEYLEKTANQSQALITVTTLEFLKRGGRLTPLAAGIASILRIKPTLLIEGGKIDAFAKPRTIQAAKEIMITETVNLIDKKFSNLGLTHRDFYLDVAYSGTDKSMAEEFAEEIKLRLEGHDDIEVVPLSLSVACHTGPGALAIGIGNRLKLD